MTASLLRPLLVAGVVFVGWGIAGLMDQANVAWDGVTTGPDHTVIQVRDGSPAAAAGLSVGDRIVRLNGVAIEDTPALNRMPRAAIGETRTIVVEPAGTEAGAESSTRDVAITYASLPARDIALRWAGFLTGLCFAGFGLLAYARAPGAASLLLAFTGLSLGITFLGGPYFASYTTRAVVGGATLMLIVFGFATLLHCVAMLPRPKAILERRSTTLMLYAPATIIALLFVWLIAFEPSQTAVRNRVVNGMIGTFIVFYFGLAVIAMLHSYAKATPAERARQGLNLMLGGVVVGLAPVTLAALVGIIAPSVVLPGSDFYALTLVLVPVALALAVMRTAPARRAPDISRSALGSPPTIRHLHNR